MTIVVVVLFASSASPSWLNLCGGVGGGGADAGGGSMAKCSGVSFPKYNA